MAIADVRGVVRASTLQIWVPLVTLWVIWGSTYLGIALVDGSMPPLLANGFRFLTATWVLAGALLIIKGPRFLRVTWSQLAYSALMGCMLLGIAIGTLSMAERYVPSGVAALIVAVMPLWIVLLRIKSGDRPSKFTFAGVALGMTGLALMLLPGGTTPRSGTDSDVVIWSFMLLLSSMSWVYFSWRSTSFTLPANTFLTTMYELLAAGAMLLGIGALRGERINFESFTRQSWFGWGWLVVASLIGYSAYSYLIANAPLSLVSTYAYVNPVVAVLLGWFIIREPVTPDVVIGLTVVLGGVILVTSGERGS